VTDRIRTEQTTFTGHGGDPVEAYLARPDDGTERRGGLVVIHHLPGFDRWTKEVARRFATDGYDTLVPNLYCREAPGASPDDAAAAARAAGGVPDDRLVGDAAGAAEHLRALPTSNGRVGILGHCSGGRHAVLAACSVPFEAVVDCYGAFVVGSPPEGHPLQGITGFEDRLGGLTGPVLGLFGADDPHPSTADVTRLDELLTGLGKEHEFHTYDEAGHAFFAADRPSYRVAAAVAGYEVIDRFLGKNLG
jgi:carboxymethylenebutenolidase